MSCLILKQSPLCGDPLERQTFYRHFAEELAGCCGTRLEIINLMDLPLAELRQTILAVLPDNTAVIYTEIHYTSDGAAPTFLPPAN